MKLQGFQGQARAYIKYFEFYCFDDPVFNYTWVFT